MKTLSESLLLGQVQIGVRIEENLSADHVLKVCTFQSGKKFIILV